jgi:hypothetical protein
MTDTQKEILLTDYEMKIDFEKYVSSDVIPRHPYYFVDVIYNDNTKETHLRFNTKAEAENFQQYISLRYYESKDITKYNTLDLLLWFAIGFVTSILVSYIIDKI